MPVPLLPAYRWLLAPAATAPPPTAEGLHPIVARIIAGRGYATPEQVRAFLAREADDDDPWRLVDMDRAVERLRRAIVASETIAVYGDFDADGVTATAIVAETLRTMGGRVLTFIPHRHHHGYGLRASALEKLADDGARVVVTVDCGVRDSDAVSAGRELGLDVIVTDHHLVGAQLPPAYAIVNPHRSDCRYGFAELSGAGVAYKLSQALAATQADAPVGTGRAPREEDLLDLVALGTIADVVPLVGENRCLVYRGLEVIRRRPRPGIDALLQVAHQEASDLTARSLAFKVVPRLNAAGRMDDATDALDLLQTDDPRTARRLARKLQDLNIARREATEEAVEQAEAQLAGQPVNGMVVYADTRIALGITGLVAGRLSERYYRPAAAVHIDGAHARGSARSIPELDITAMLESVADLLVRFGGHARAAGFALASDRLPELTRRLDAAARERLAGLDLRPSLVVDAELARADVGLELYEALQQVAPFGEGNPRPVLVLRGVRAAGPRTIGIDHLRFQVNGGAGSPALDAVAFSQAHRRGALAEAGPIDVVFHLGRSDWGGQARAELEVLDMAASGLGLAPRSG